DGIRDRTVTGVQTCALPISRVRHQRLRSNADDQRRAAADAHARWWAHYQHLVSARLPTRAVRSRVRGNQARDRGVLRVTGPRGPDRKSTRLNSSHRTISYAV